MTENGQKRHMKPDQVQHFVNFKHLIHGRVLGVVGSGNCSLLSGKAWICLTVSSPVWVMQRYRKERAAQRLAGECI